MPKTTMLMISTGRTPYLSMAQPIAGDSTNADKAPALTAPEIKVRLHPNSWESGYMKTVSVVMFGAILAKTAVPAAPTTTQPK